MMRQRSVKDQEICDLLNARDQRGMELLFEAYYKSLVSWANTFLNDLGVAEDVVQEFFYRSVESRDSPGIKAGNTFFFFAGVGSKSLL